MKNFLVANAAVQNGRTEDAVLPAGDAPADAAPVATATTEEVAAVESPAASAPEPEQLPVSATESIPDSDGDIASSEYVPPIAEEEPAPSVEDAAAPAGSSMRESVSIDPQSGRVMSAPAARPGRVPPGGHSTLSLW